MSGAAIWVAVCLAAPPFDSEVPNPFLAQAKEHYEGLDFEKCMQRIKQAAAWKGSSTREQKDIEVFGALCALNLGQRNEAAERFKLALRLDEDLELPEFASPKAVKLFLYVKRKLRQPTVAPLPDEDLPPDAPAPAERTAMPPVEPAPSPVAGTSTHRSLWVPALLGAGAVASTLAAVALGAATKSVESSARAQLEAHAFESDYLATRNQAQALAVATTVAWGLAIAWVSGALLALLLR